MRHSAKHHYTSLAIISASFSAILLGCASPPPQAAAPQSQSYERVATISGSGVVEAIEVTHKESSGVAGAVIGGVAGGLLGSAVGGGTGQAVATVAGAAGGALVGNKVEKSNAANQPVYNIRVRMDDGSLQSFAQNDNTDFRVGDRVRLDNGRISRY